MIHNLVIWWESPRLHICIYLPWHYMTWIHSYGSMVKWLWFLRPMSQRVYELLVEILQTFSCFITNSNDPIRSQICTCPDSSAVGTCAKLWPDLVVILSWKIGKNFYKFWIMGSYKLLWIGCQWCLMSFLWDKICRFHVKMKGWKKIWDTLWVHDINLFSDGCHIYQYLYV